MDQSEKKISGLFLIEDINFVVKEKGLAGKEQLKKFITELDLDNLRVYRTYPLEKEIALLRAVAIVVYGDDSEESWRKLGKHDFDTTLKTTWGKSFFTLLGKKPEMLFKKLFPVGQRILPFFKFTYRDLTKNGATIVMEDDPYPFGYYYGCIQSLNEYFGGTQDAVEKSEIGKRVRIYKLQWKID